MGEIKWRNIDDEKPMDGQDCLTICKHGMIQGDYDERDGYFRGYYWVDMRWYADKWVPIDEVQP